MITFDNDDPYSLRNWKVWKPFEDALNPKPPEFYKEAAGQWFKLLKPMYFYSAQRLPRVQAIRFVYDKGRGFQVARDFSSLGHKLFREQAFKLIGLELDSFAQASPNSESLDAERLVSRLLESDDVDPKSFIKSHGQQLDGPSRKHLFVSSTDGGLYDTRKPDWHKGPPIRKGYQYFHRDIHNLAEFKSTWRARHSSNYSLGFLTDDGAVLCESCVEKNLQRIMRSIRDGDRDGWRVVGVGTLHGDPVEAEDAQCAHCNKNLGELG